MVSPMLISFQRPAAVVLNGFINLRHQLARLRQRKNNSCITANILEGKLSFLSILQPALCGQIAADGEFPHGLRHRLEVLTVVDPNAAWLTALQRLIVHVGNFVFARNGEAWPAAV